MAYQDVENYFKQIHLEDRLIVLDESSGTYRKNISFFSRGSTDCSRCCRNSQNLAIKI